MTAWGRQKSIGITPAMLPNIMGLLMVPLFIATLLFSLVAQAGVAQAALSTNKVINFQGRLLTNSGSVVADGNYNMQFKIYHGGSGAAVGNPDGTLAWTESYVNNGGSSGITVRNGVFSVRLGSVNQFGSSVDWNQDRLWLSMNIAGSAAACATFGTAPCAADGEMLPMNQITSVPNAINSSAVGGKTAENLVQLAQGVQTDASSNTSSIFINKTGTGNLVQLQNAATDIFTINNSGDLALGSNSDKTISVNVADPNESGRKLSIVAGSGGSGDGSAGGDLVLQGGNAGGAEGNAGNVQIDAGAATGGGAQGTISIGATNAGTIAIGSSAASTNQTITIGGNTSSNSTTNVTVGSGGSAGGGSTTIQAKDSVTIATNGVNRAIFSSVTNTVYFGNGVSASQPDDFTIQGTNSSATAVAGGSLNMQGGNATTGDANGGNIILSGGSGSGSGSTGLVVLGTPVFSTVTNDVSCFNGGSPVSGDCTISDASVNGAAAVIVGFSNAGRRATVPDPRNATPGRIVYVMASSGSRDFVLSINGGGGSNDVAMKGNTTTTLIWNGTDWTVAGGSNAASLQSSYEGTPQNAGRTELVLNSTPSTSGLTIRDGGSNQLNDSLLEVRNSQSASLFSINNRIANGTEHASDGGASDSDNFATNWTAVGGATVNRMTVDGQAGGDSAQVVAGTGADNGVRHKLSINPTANTGYRLSFYAKLTAGSSLEDISAKYSPDGGTTFVDCTDYTTQGVALGEWTQVVCTVATGNTAVTDPYIYIVQPTTAQDARTFLVDTLSFVVTPQNTSNVKVGNDGEDTTLFTVDKSAGAPVTGNHEGLLGSIYYDTIVGKLQCYEAQGWGACGASPDSFITLSPEYANAVTHGEGVGTLSSGFCSDTLDINDGSPGQPAICSSSETYNFYQWTSPEVTAQHKSLFVTYQLPENFKEFVGSSTSLMGRTNSDDASVNYHIYKNNGQGLASCGTEVAVSTGNKNAWQKASASGSADPAQCDFSAGDSIVIRINLTAAQNANTYISNLSFAYSIQ